MCLTDYLERIDNLLADVERGLVHWIDTGDLDIEGWYNSVRAARTNVSAAKQNWYAGLDSVKNALTST